MRWAVFCAAGVLAACATQQDIDRAWRQADREDAEAALARLEGRDIHCAIAVLGYPDGHRFNGERRVYDWRRSAPVDTAKTGNKAARPADCRITLAFDADGRVDRWTALGARTSCGIDEVFYERLASASACEPRK